MKKICMFVVAMTCFIAGGCDPGTQAPPGGGGAGSGTTGAPKQTSSNSEVGDSQLVKVSLAVPNMT